MKDEAGALLREAYNLIDEMIKDIPLCSCHPNYISRRLIDPSCIHCDTMENHIYVGMVAWRNKIHNLTMIAHRYSGTEK